MKNKTPIKILFVISLFDRLGGAEKNLRDVLLNLDKKKFKPYVIAFKGGFLSHFISTQGIHVEVYNIGKLLSLHTILKSIALFKFIRSEGIDIVVSYHHDADIFGGLVAKLAGVTKTISCRRDMGYQLEKKHIAFYRSMGWVFSHFLTVSDAVKNEVHRREGINKHRITTIYNGIDANSIKLNDEDNKIKLMQELGLSSDKLTIGMVASFRPIKGQLYLVDAIKKMKEWHGKIQVIIVGHNETEYFIEVKERILSYGLESLFVFPGSRDDVCRLLNIMDIFVISSINEGFSNAIIEAMSVGLPVVAPDSGGNAEAVQNNESGILFKPCNSDDLADKLLKLLENCEMRKIMGRKGKDIVDKAFGLKQMICKYENVFLE